MSLSYHRDLALMGNYPLFIRTDLLYAATRFAESHPLEGLAFFAVMKCSFAVRVSRLRGHRFSNLRKIMFDLF